jgi:L-asparaginase
MTTVSVLAMGGTIATAQTADGARPSLTADRLVESVSRSVKLRARDVRTLASHTLSLDDVWALAEEVKAEIASGADGIVVTHGTDTLEETAYALSLLVDTPVPVVVTGAMRAPHLPGPDGAANLAAAVACAVHRPLAEYGPVVLFQDEIHVARLVTKTHSTRMAAFGSPAAGPVGYVAEDTVELLLGPPPVDDRLVVTAAPRKRVDVVWTGVGVGPEPLDAVAGEVDGLVIAAMGAGHVTPAFAQSLARLAGSGLPLVLASRCVDGPQLRGSYGGIGTETHLFGLGMAPAGILSPAKARLRLVFGLSAGLTRDQLFAPVPTR